MRIKEDCGHGSKDEKAYSECGEKRAVPIKRLRGLGSSDGSGRYDVSNCNIGNNELWQQLGGEGVGSHQWAERHQLWQLNPLFHYRGDLQGPGTHWKLKVVLLEREKARDQTFQRDSGRR